MNKRNDLVSKMEKLSSIYIEGERLRNTKSISLSVEGETEEHSFTYLIDKIEILLGKKYDISCEIAFSTEDKMHIDILVGNIVDKEIIVWYNEEETIGVKFVGHIKSINQTSTGGSVTTLQLTFGNSTPVVFIVNDEEIGG